MSVNHPKNFWSPIKMLEFLGLFVNRNVKMLELGQDAGFLMTYTVKMLEFLGLTQSKCWSCEDLL